MDEGTCRFCYRRIIRRGRKWVLVTDSAVECRDEHGRRIADHHWPA